MKLFIRGPAFGLPSIDAECIAAVALLQLYGLRDWDLIPEHDDSRRLPLLLDHENALSGFNDIARYLRRIGDDHAKDDVLSTPLTTFIETRAQLLLDVSLYVSFENYRLATRPAFTKILPWYANYITPPKLRSEARLRTESLGISSIDVDDVHEDLSNRPGGNDGVIRQQQQTQMGGEDGDTQKRASLLLPRKETVRSLLGKPQHAAAFRLHALAESFFTPLQEVLGEQSFLLGEEISPVDCLAYGYLSLMLYPSVPQNWLSTSLRQKFPLIVAYVTRLDSDFNVRASVTDVMALGKCQSMDEIRAHRTAHHMELPWFPPSFSSFSQFATSSLSPPSSSSSSVSTAIRKSSLWSNLRWTFISLYGYFSPFGRTARISPVHPPLQTFLQRYGLAIAGFVSVSLGAGVYRAFQIGALVWPTGSATQIFGRTRPFQLDHLGAALAGLSLLNREALGEAAFHSRHDLPIEVEVAAEA